MTHASWTPRSRLLKAALAATALALLGACASTPPPTAELAVGRAAVERATGTAAADAPIEMAAARDKITRADAAYADENYALAKQLALEADADATLAEAQSRSVRSDHALTEVNEGIRMLREEMARK